MKTFCLFILAVCSSHIALGQAYQTEFQHLVDSFYQAHPKSVGIMIAVEDAHKNTSWTYAAGYSDKHLKTAINANQPALTASNTKTYVAAAILKLAEQRKLNIEDGIAGFINKQSNEWLLKAGYRTHAIKIKHILSHTSGIADYVNDDYFAFVGKHKNHEWTRDEQIKLATSTAKPLSQPGDTFSYADINYLLATEIIEHITKQPYYTAIATLLEFDKNNLQATRFIAKQKAPAQSAPPVHQYYDKWGWDSYELNPSWDLYGGGGIVTTTKDLALFFQLLFEGKIIRDTNVLSQMCTPVYSKTNYCLGIRKVALNGYTGYYHGGWWGTDAIYFPELKTAVSIYILERGEKDISADICKGVLNIIGTR